MRWFLDLKISAKLLLGFVLVAVVAGLVGLIGSFNINVLDQADKNLYRENTLAIAETAQIVSDYQQTSNLLRDLIFDQNAAEKRQHLAEIAPLQKNISQMLARIKKYANSEKEQRAYENLAAALANFKPVEQRITQVALQEQDQQALSLLRGEGTVLDQAVDNAAAALNDLELELAKQSAANNDSQARQAIVLMVVIIIVGIVIAIGLGIFIAGIISKPLRELVGAADKIARGDVTIDMTATTKDETGTLMNAFGQMTKNIKEQATIAARISEGDLTVEVKPRSDQDVLSQSMKQMVETLQNVVSEVKMLAAASIEGRLDRRGESVKFKGGYREIVTGFNNTLDAVIEPIKEASGVLQEVAQGNLQVNVTGDYRGDHAAIKEALNHTIASLNGVLGEINNAAEQVSSGSKQVSLSSQALSQGSTEQASSLEEITSSITEIAAQTKQNAVNANQANELAMSASDSATLGNQQMKGMLKAMEEINDSSGNISKIIKVIDEIAFQTNILALNAAVEAARAGQHGKGFAVVAEEVRNLAARSANAAKETTALIEGSIKKVETGTKIAMETAEALNKIVSGVSEAASLVAEIAAASNQQASGISQINQGIEQVSQVTQANTATAEESASASEELSSQAELLRNMVRKFRLKNRDMDLADLAQFNPEVMKLLEEMVGKKNSPKKVSSKMAGGGPAEAAAAEAAAATVADGHPRDAKIKIRLDDHDFGKY